ncbi:MAG: hypothetical protein EAY81_08440 [Bacteroidetes bacterium]|nr:MAG: hypothetical protein EAY81_08440 [Bacteroidota bacterium]
MLFSFSHFLSLDMLLKNQIIENMPNELSTEDVIERIVFIQKIEQGIADVQQNNVVNEGKIDYLIDKWSKLH